MLRPGPIKVFLKRYRHPGDLVFAVLFLLVSLFLLSQVGNETKWIKNTKLFAQPAFWPVISLAGMSLFAFLHFLSSISSTRNPGRVQEIILWAKSLEYALWFMAYVWIVPIVGYLPTSLFFVCLLSLRCGYRDRNTISSAVGLGIVIVVIFKGLLAVKIPGGAIYEYLPTFIRNFMILYL